MLSAVKPQLVVSFCEAETGADSVSSRAHHSHPNLRRNFAGNAHWVLCFEDPRELEFDQLLEKSRPYFHNELINVVAVKQQSVWSARFFQKGREVLRCGSGSVALAKVLDTRALLPRVLTIDTAVGSVNIGKSKNQYFYEAPFLKTVPSRNAKLWSRLLGEKVIRLSELGSSTDYCIAEISSEQALAKLKPRLRRICLFSKRAVIVTSPSKRADYAMRYFAPQYSPREDAATGSANAQLAQHWQGRLHKKKIHGVQYSHAGGRFQVVQNNRSQKVFGFAKILSAGKETHR